MGCTLSSDDSATHDLQSCHPNRAARSQLTVGPHTTEAAAVNQDEPNPLSPTAAPLRTTPGILSAVTRNSGATTTVTVATSRTSPVSDSVTPPFNASTGSKNNSCSVSMTSEMEDLYRALDEIECVTNREVNSGNGNNGGGGNLWKQPIGQQLNDFSKSSLSVPPMARAKSPASSISSL